MYANVGLNDPNHISGKIRVRVSNHTFDRHFKINPQSLLKVIAHTDLVKMWQIDVFTWAKSIISASDMQITSFVAFGRKIWFL